MVKMQKNISSVIAMPLLFALSIVGLSLPFVWYELGWLSMVGLLPFLYFLQLMRVRKIAVKQQLGLIWVVGLSVFLVVLSWSLQTNPEKWAFISGRQADLALGLVFIGFSLVLSLQYLIFGSLYMWLKPRFTSKTIFLIFPAIWVVAEAGRSILFSLVVAGPGGSIGTYWNFGVLGIAGSVTPLGYLSRFVGMFGMSFVGVVINLCIFWLLQKRWKLPVVLFILAILASIVCYIAWQPPSQAQKIQAGLIQLQQSFDGYVGEKSYYRIINEKTANERQKTDLLILPEYSDFFTNTEATSEAKDTATKISKSNGALVTSINQEDSGKQKNHLVLYTPDATVQASQDKTFLIPIGEYLPYLFIGVFKLFNQQQLLQMHQQSRVITQGTVQDGVLVATNGLRLGSLACSGAIAPELYRNLGREGAQVLTNSASLGIFTGAPLYHQQSRQFARFIAISNARPYIQSASGAYSYIIDSNGNFVVRTGDFKTQFGSAELALVRTRTIYTVIGEWVVWVSFGLIIVFGTKKVLNLRDVSK